MNMDKVLRDQLGGLPSPVLRMAYSEDADLLADYAAALNRELTGLEYILPVFCDASDCPQLSDWMCRAGQSMMTAAEEHGFLVFPEDKAQFASPLSESDLGIGLVSLCLSFLTQGAHIFLIAEHFEQAALWSSNMAWVRAFFCAAFKDNMTDLPAGANFSVIVLADRTMDLITGSKPMSSSSVANLFFGKTQKLTRDGEDSL